MFIYNQKSYLSENCPRIIKIQGNLSRIINQGPKIFIRRDFMKRNYL